MEILGMCKVETCRYLLIQNSMENILPLSLDARNFRHGIYRHYKGGEYKTHFVARNSETLEEMIVYQDLHDSEKVWCRPLTMFLEELEIEGKSIPRFLKINE